MGVALVPAPPEAAGEAVPPIGAVDCPLISACTDELNVPVMLVMLNLAENARAGYWGFVESLRLRDWNRMKLGEGGEAIWGVRGREKTYYSSVLGPIVGSGVKTMVWVFEVSTLGVIVCKRV